MPESADVLIAGAGPTGMTAAIALAMAGKRVILIDKHKQRLGFSRAILVNNQSLHILEPLGVAQRIVKRGTAITRMQIFNDDACILDARITASLERQGRVDAMPINLAQLETEACFEERLVELDVGIERPWALQDFVQDENGVTARLVHYEDSTRTREIRCDYLIGADGFHSITRQLLGIQYPTTELPNRLWGVDVEVGTLPFQGSLAVRRHNGRIAMALKLDDRHARYVVIHPEDHQEVEQWLDVKKVVWASEFNVYFAVAEKLGDRRVWLAGDAAHVHSPIGGRGMNMGIADGDALAKAILSRSFEQYTRERHQAAAEWVSTNERLSTMVMSDALPARSVRSLMFAFLRVAGKLSPDTLAQFIVRNLAGVDVRPHSDK